MKNLKWQVALLSGKLIRFLTRSLRIGGGTAAPGLIALNINPNLIHHFSNLLAGTIAITGTNGKTTTSRMLDSILAKAGVATIHNRAGSNLLRGIASTIIEKWMIGKKLDKVWAIWEIDEAVVPAAVEQINPKILVITNLFRDQLDRYGEIDKVRKLWADAISKLSRHSILILNADDPTVAHLGHKASCKVIHFGIGHSNQSEKNISRAADTKYCPNCATKLYYAAVYASHLGEYFCKKCRFARPQLQVAADKITCLDPTSAEFRLVTKSKKAKISLNVGGLYNIYNSLAAAAASLSFGLNLAQIATGLQAFQAAFGRIEQLKIGKTKVSLILVKNPTGANEVNKTIFSNHQKRSVLIALNDKIADGTDISWIWDVDFEKLAGKVDALTISGTRAYDLALRLKYAQITPNKVHIEPNFGKAISIALKHAKGQLFILPTYTAMLEIRKVLNKLGFGEKFWEN